MDENLEDYGAGMIGRPRRGAWAMLAGAGLGLALAAILAFGGFGSFLVALLFAIVGGAIARFWVGEG